MSSEHEILSYPEAADLLQISERTLERWVRERRIPFIQFPKRGARSGVRFMRVQVLRWLEQQTVRPIRSRASAAKAVTVEED